MEHRRQRKIPEERWLMHKKLIEELWLEANCTFPQVAVQLAKDRVFAHLTKRQFEHHIKIWGFQKQRHPQRGDRSAKPQSQPTLALHQAPSATGSQISEPPRETHLVDFIRYFTLGKKVFNRWQHHHAPQEENTSEDEASGSGARGVELHWESPPEHLVYFPVGATLKLAAINLDCPEILVLTDGWAWKLDIDSQDFYHSLQQDQQYQQANSAQRMCDYAKAEAMYWDLIQSWRDGLCPTDRRVFELYRLIAVCLMNKGALRKAREITTQLYDVTQNLLPPTDWQSLWVLKTMAAVNERSGPGMLALAEQQYRQLWEISERLYGETCGFTVTARAGIASVLRLQDKLLESQEMYAEVVELRAQADPNNVDDFSHCQELRQYADVLSYRNLFQESIPMYRLAEEKALAGFGPSHQITLRIQSNLAADLRIASQYQLSSESLLKTYIKQHELLDEDHPDPSWTLYQYAKCIMLMGQFENALMWMKDVYEYRRQHLGVLHVRTINCVIWLGWLSENANQWVEALSYYQRAWRRLNRLARSDRSENYSTIYRPRWINKAIARMRLLTESSVFEDEGVRQTLERDALEEIEVTDPDNNESPVQFVIEVESDCPETCGVVF